MRCVKDDLVVPPQALEELQGPALVVLRFRLYNFGQRSLSVDGTEQPVFKSIDSANEIGKRMRPVDLHRDSTRGQTFPDAHRPW
jgi:hypothetical protein